MRSASPSPRSRRRSARCGATCTTRSSSAPGRGSGSRRGASGWLRPLLRLAVTASVAEVVSAPLLDAFTRRRAALEVAQEVAAPDAFAALLEDRRADVALGPRLSAASIPFLRAKLVAVAAPAEARG